MLLFFFFFYCDLFHIAHHVRYHISYPLSSIFVHLEHDISLIIILILYHRCVYCERIFNKNLYGNYGKTV